MRYITDRIVLTDNRIIVPVSLRNKILNELHEDKFGLNKIKTRARELYYWLVMSKDIVNFRSVKLVKDTVQLM